MDYKISPIQRGHVPRKLKKQRRIKMVILFLVLLLVSTFIIMHPQKIGLFNFEGGLNTKPCFDK